MRITGTAEKFIFILFISLLPACFNNPSGFPSITQVPCHNQITKERGVCMFYWSCTHVAHGVHIASCMDRFLIGSCCKLPEETQEYARWIFNKVSTSKLSAEQNMLQVPVSQVSPGPFPQILSQSLEESKERKTTNKVLTLFSTETPRENASQVKIPEAQLVQSNTSTGIKNVHSVHQVPTTIKVSSFSSAFETSHDMRKPVRIEQTHSMRQPVLIEASHHVQKPVAAEPSHDNRKPISVEPYHDIRKPVGFYHALIPTLPHASGATVDTNFDTDLKLNETVNFEPVSDSTSLESSFELFQTHNPLLSSALENEKAVFNASILMTSGSDNSPKVDDISHEIFFADSLENESSSHAVNSDKSKARPKPEKFTNEPEFSGQFYSTSYASPSSIGSSYVYKTINGTKCGISPAFPSARIVGGEKADYLRWPWMISLRRLERNNYKHRCGAVLLNFLWAITVAHCVDRKLPSEIILHVGEYNLHDTTEFHPHREMRVYLIVVHPDFNPHTYENDVALLRFYKPVQNQVNIAPICLPDLDDDLSGKTAVVTGWGRLSDEGELPGYLQEVRIPIISNEECQRMYLEAGYSEIIPETFLCAGRSTGGLDACEGDSGGPMLIKSSHNQWLLVGLISWGMECGAPRLPGVYTRVSKFVDWIKTFISI